MEKKKTAGQKLVEALRKAGYKITTVTIIETPEDIQRHKDVRDFIRKLNEAHEATKNSKLRFDTCVASPA